MSSVRHCSTDVVSAPGSTRTTRSHPRIPRPNNSRAAARSCRRMRFRCTALPTALLTTKPNRTGLTGAVCTTENTAQAATVFEPVRMTLRKSAPVTRRLARANTTVTPRVRYVPYGDVRRESHDQRGCACEVGNRASWRDGGCWAGKYACSCQSLDHLRGPHET